MTGGCQQEKSFSVRQRERKQQLFKIASVSPEISARSYRDLQHLQCNVT
jgi:hypothetical protein